MRMVPVLAAIGLSLALAVTASCKDKSSAKKKDEPAATAKSGGESPDQQDRPAIAEADEETGVGPSGAKVNRRTAPDQRLKSYDADGDGKLSEDERASMIQQRLDRTFAEIDGDSDGVLSREELESSSVGMARRLVRRFERIDEDKSGGLSRQELESSMTRRPK